MGLLGSCAGRLIVRSHFYGSPKPCLFPGLFPPIASPGTRPRPVPYPVRRQPQPQRPLHFSSGVFVLPHPEKMLKGGEDWYFMSNCQRAIGVADGVGGWVRGWGGGGAAREGRGQMAGEAECVRGGGRLGGRVGGPGTCGGGPVGDRADSVGGGGHGSGGRRRGRLGVHEMGGVGGGVSAGSRVRLGGME